MLSDRNAAECERCWGTQVCYLPPDFDGELCECVPTGPCPGHRFPSCITGGCLNCGIPRRHHYADNGYWKCVDCDQHRVFALKNYEQAELQAQIQPVLL